MLHRKGQIAKRKESLPRFRSKQSGNTIPQEELTCVAIETFRDVLERERRHTSDMVVERVLAAVKHNEA